MNVPQLRFKLDNGQDFLGWTNDSLGNFSHSIQSGKSKERKDSGKYVLYGSTNAIGFSDKFEYQGKNILIARVGANAGYIYEVDGCYCVSDNTLILSLENPNNHSFFFNLLTKSNLNKLVFGSGQPLITGGLLKSLVVAVPLIAEQTKIANFLTAVDEKITQLYQKHDLLTQYKKGVMQQIFSQELRFKDEDGQDFPEWEEKTIGDIFTFIQTNSFSRELLNYETGNVKNIHYGDIHTKFKSNFKIENENVPFIKPNIDLSKISTDCYCKEGDLVIADASEDYADVGKAIEIISLKSQKLLSGLHTYIARDLSKLMSLGFSGYLMQTETVRLQIKTLATGVSVLGISKGNLTKVKLNIPTKPEQTKIANFLTYIDDKITVTQTQLHAVKQYKQGLLQQMFV